MTKNSLGGKKAKRSKNSNAGLSAGKRPMMWAEDQQLYGKVQKILGDMRCEVLCGDGVVRICRIRGKMKGRVYIVAGDVVLICLREFEDGKADLIHKYNQGEIKNLKDTEEFNVDTIRPGLMKSESLCVNLEGLIMNSTTTTKEEVEEEDFISFEEI